MRRALALALLASFAPTPVHAGEPEAAGAAGLAAAGAADLAAAAVDAQAEATARRAEDRWFRSGQAAVQRARALLPQGAPARNVILFVGDGMDAATITAARILEGQQRGESGEDNSLSFETLPFVALVKTYNTDQQVPDSAGTMTAMVSGVKTRAGVLGVDEGLAPRDHGSVPSHRVPTILEEAEGRGLATGLVTTTTLTHATPAACYAHSASRYWEDDSLLSGEARKEDFPDNARQFLEFSVGDGIEVALAGGRAHFLPANATDPEEPQKRGQRWDERDLVAEWKSLHPEGTYVWNEEQLEALDPDAVTRLLGLFDPHHMEFEVDRASDKGGEPSLSAMTELAIRILARDREGFFLMVEGGRIDHGHHAGNAHRALTETIEFSNAVRTALELTRRDDTLVVVTSDHGHTLTMGGYPTLGNPILGKVENNDASGKRAGWAKDGAGLPYTTLAYANGPGHLAESDLQPEGHKRYPHHSLWFGFENTIPGGRPDLSEVDTEAAGFLQEATVPRRSETHSGADVAVYAGGPRASLFHGVQEQHFVYHALVEALGWNQAPTEVTRSE